MDPHGRRIAGLDFARGYPQDANGKTVSANVPPALSGIPSYDRQMTDEDLKSAFAFLLTLTPVKHSVDNSLMPTKCRLCGHEHGGGERN